ncbi:MAG: hypothetical protein ABL934_12470 [Lysobacteraceae bacterium]
MGRIWIGMEMAWGVSRGGDDIEVILMQAQKKTEERPFSCDDAIASKKHLLEF